MGSGNLLCVWSILTGEKALRKFDFVVLKKVRDMKWSDRPDLSTGMFTSCQNFAPFIFLPPSLNDFVAVLDFMSDS